MKNLFLGLVMLVGTASFANASTKTAVSNNTIEATISSEVKTSKTYVFDANDTQGIESLKNSAKEAARDITIIVICSGNDCLVIIIVSN